MFEQKKAVFYYAISPVHMGAGVAIGMVDNPIQREVHTGHPIFAGSGLKGVFRHEAGVLFKDKNVVNRIFGPEDDGNKYAGAVSFTDAQVLFFPVRSAKHAFVWITSPYVLQRAIRLLEVAGNCNAPVDDLNTLLQPVTQKGEKEKQLTDFLETKYAMFDTSLMSNNKLVLETFWFDLFGKNDESLKKQWMAFDSIVKWFAGMIFGNNPGFEGFKKKFKEDAVLVSDQVFNYFVQNATIVEPHVRIEDNTGTAKDQGLFYTENLPPETIMIGLMMASKERQKEGKSAMWIEKQITDKFDDKTIQIGGDSTTGRGLVYVKFGCKEGGEQ